MRIIIEDIDGSHYQDIIISIQELEKLTNGHVLEGMAIVKSKRHYIGLRVGDRWRHENEASPEFLNTEIAE